MLKKLLNVVRRKLLKVEWIKREVEAYRIEQQKKRHKERWAQLMSSGRKVRNLKPEKKDIDDTLEIVMDDGMIVGYLDGRIVSQRYLDANLIRPFGIWRR